MRASLTVQQEAPSSGQAPAGTAGLTGVATSEILMLCKLVMSPDQWSKSVVKVGLW